MKIFNFIEKYFQEKEDPSIRQKREAIFQDDVLENWIKESKTSLEALKFLMSIRGNYISSNDYAIRAVPEEISRERIAFLNKKTALAIESVLNSGDLEIRKYALEQLWHIEEIESKTVYQSLKKGIEDGILDFNKSHDVFSFGCPIHLMEREWGEEMMQVLLKAFAERIEFVKENPAARGGDGHALHILSYLKDGAKEFPFVAKYLQGIADDPVLCRTKIAKEIYN